MEVGRWISMAVWVTAALMLLPAVVRLIRGKGRHLDLLWLAAFFLMDNRISFQLRQLLRRDEMLAWCTWTGIAAGLFYLYIIWGYQRGDR